MLYCCILYAWLTFNIIWSTNSELSWFVMIWNQRDVGVFISCMTTISTHIEMYFDRTVNCDPFQHGDVVSCGQGVAASKPLSKPNKARAQIFHQTSYFYTSGKVWLKVWGSIYLSNNFMSPPRNGITSTIRTSLTRTFFTFWVIFWVCADFAN